MLKIKSLIVAIATTLALTACSKDNDREKISHNLSVAADKFEINRRVVFYNGITNTDILAIEGRCAFEAESEHKVNVTCRVGPNEYKKHTLGISDNVTYISEQLDAAQASAYHYRVVFRPQAIIPDIQLDLKGSKEDDLK